MRRPGTQLTPEVLVEEARFILRTLKRDDLFGDRVRLTEAERVLDSSISLSFADYCGFLSKYGYVRVDQLANRIELTEGGAIIAEDRDDPEFHLRLTKHFARELGTGTSSRPLPRRDVAMRSESPGATAKSSRPTVIAASPSVDEVLDRRYRRGEVIGTGTLGAVYRARHATLGRELAIKEARSIFQFASYLRRDEIVRRIRTTVERHAQLQHPGILQIFDQNLEREYPYYVVELASGGSLRQRMAAEEDGRLDLPAAIRVLLQICYALKYAHEQGVLHVGLKPENVLFDAQGNVKISDFGLAHITDRTDSTGQTPVLVGGGMVGYLAPERLQPSVDAPDLKPASDIYSLGMLFYEMITGKLPGRRSPMPSQVRKEVPSAFDEVFDHMTRDELAERYASVDQVLEGVYKAFPTKEVFAQGTILLWAKDPKPLPAPEAPAEEPEPVAAVENGELSEIVTGEIAAEAPEGVKTTVAPPKKRPPPPPRK